MTPKKTLKKWFSNFMKPAQEHFAAWIDSFWHKSEQIPMSSIDGLSRAIENTASAGQLLNHLDDTNAHHALFEELKRQIQAIQTILQVDDVNLDTLQEIVTELKANTKLQELIDKKVNKEEGKGLSANDFTNEHKQKLEELQPTDVSGLLPKGGYDGTGQELKEAIEGLQTKMQQVETTLSVDDTTFDTLQEIVTQVKSNKNLETLLTSKVDKEEGKGLSANDFTNELKNKLENLPNAEDTVTKNVLRNEIRESENLVLSKIERNIDSVVYYVVERFTQPKLSAAESKIQEMGKDMQYVKDQINVFIPNRLDNMNVIVEQYQNKVTMLDHDLAEFKEKEIKKIEERIAALEAKG